MIKPFRFLLALGLAVAFLGSASEAAAQAADTKRTLKAWQVFYMEPGMIEADVRYMRGTLMIQGTVPSEEHIKKADELAGELRGIKEVRNRLRVREPEVAAGGDEEIKAKLAKKFEEDEEVARTLAKGDLEYTVENGHVTLKGKLDDYTVAAGVLNDVRKTVGVQTIDFKKLKY